MLASEAAAGAVDVGHLQVDSLAKACQATAIGCRSVDSWEESDSRVLWENDSRPDGQENDLGCLFVNQSRCLTPFTRW
jgi:hypothetical protein